jgi:protein TonB
MKRRRRFLPIAIALSLAVHIAAALMVVFLSRVLPKEASQPEQGTVELLMVERKGAEPSAAGQPRESQPTPPQPEKRAEVHPPEAQKSETPAAPSPTPPAPPAMSSPDEKAPPPAGQMAPKEAKMAEQQDVQQPSVKPVAPKEPDRLVFDLAGTESESNAEVVAGHVLPASPDDRFRNRPPVYPPDAAIRGEHGAVLLVIHVSEGGFATGADVVESSGVASLDQAAASAVLKWHFRPALREGRAVPFDMPFRFVFKAD